MPITYQHGTPSMYAQAAQIIGESERIKTENQVQAQRDLDDFKIKLSLEAEQRVRAWELEKMTLASQNDFAILERERQILADRELAKRIQRQDELEAGLKAISESDDLDPITKKRELLKYKMEKMYNYQMSRPEKQDELTAILQQLGIGGEQVAGMKEGGVVEPERPGGLISKEESKTLRAQAIREPTTWAEPSVEDWRKAGEEVMKQKLTPPVVQNLQLNETDRARLNTLDNTSKKEFEVIFNSNNPQLIQVALNRLRNL